MTNYTDDRSKTSEQLHAELEHLRAELDFYKRRDAEQQQQLSLLTQQPEWFQEVLNQIPAMLQVVDASGRLKWVNREWETTLGWTLAGIQGRDLLSDLYPDAEVRQDVILDRQRADGVWRTYPTRSRTGKVLETIWAMVRLADGSSLGIGKEITKRRQVEEELRRSNAILQAQQEASVAGILVVNERREVVFYNQRFCQLWNIPQASIEPIVGSKDYWKLLKLALAQLKDPEAFLARVESLYQNPEEISHDEITFKDGRILDRRSAPLRLPSGECYGRVWHFQDITEIKQAEATLRKSEEKFIKIFRANPDPVAIMTFPEGRYLEANESFYRATGYDLPEVIGNTPIALNRWVYLEEQHRYMQALRMTGSVYNQEATLRIKSGAIRVVLQSAELIELDGQLCVVAVDKDITDRKQIEAELNQYQDHLEALVADRTVELNQTNQQLQQELRQREQAEATLRESERRWRTLMDDVRLLVVGLDMQMTITYVNPFLLEVMGYSREELLDKNWNQVFASPQAGQSSSLAFCMTDFQVHHQDTVPTKTGELRRIAWNCTLLRNPQGEAIGLLSIGEDITERYLIERMKDEFISVVSHEFRTPLTAIHVAVDLLVEGLVELPSERGQQLIAIASEGANRLVYLVDNILDLERLDSGKVELVMQPHNLADLMTRATDLMQLMADEAAVHLSVQPFDFELMIDGERMLQVLTNLLSNAIKFSPRGSTVWLDAELQTEQDAAAFSAPASVRFRVKDQGRGIPADKLETIFERFQQVDASDSRHKGGTGLGLAICRSIVEQHGGQIWAESGSGEGSCFYVTLPVLEGCSGLAHGNFAVDFGD